MDICENPLRNLWEDLCLRPSSLNQDVISRVEKIIDRVRMHGDTALRELSMEIEKRKLDNILVSDAEIREAIDSVSERTKRAVENAASNIRRFHEAQLPSQIEVETAKGVKCIQKPLPIEKVGLYIPAGTAPLFSTILMLALPAQIAGCKEVSLCSPAGPSGKIAAEVLYAAHFCGVKNIYKIGGAQAIAAMAYGTETVSRVYKIFGPGNQYVTTAKQLLNGKVVAIDMPAGPSEVMVIADETSNPSYAAADLLSQAEHGRDSQVMLLSSSKSTLNAIADEVMRQVELLGRKDLAETALSHSRFILFDLEEDIVDFANFYAPEHLIVSTEKPWEIVDRITAAGSVFVGHYTPESAGDYASGTNHTLPTCGWARSFSGVNIDSFTRKMTIQEISREGLEGLSETIVAMAEAEGLDAHAQAVKIRVTM